MKVVPIFEGYFYSKIGTPGNISNLYAELKKSAYLT